MVVNDNGEDRVGLFGSDDTSLWKQRLSSSSNSGRVLVWSELNYEYVSAVEFSFGLGKFVEIGFGFGMMEEF